MGGSLSKPSSCKVRNRLGCPVQLLAAQPAASAEAAARQIFHRAELAHGSEHVIQAEFHEPGLVVAVRFEFRGQEVEKAFKVPNEAVLLLRAFDKELAFRLAGPSGSEPAPELAWGAALWE
ncbi:unnamed protein product, partial [Effrenium voratum]